MSGYIKRIRQKVGHDLIIHPAVRVVVENEEGEILAIMRRDHGRIGLIAGALEEGESLPECAAREVREETGLEVRDLILIGLSSNPRRETVQYPNGDRVRYVTAEFFTRSWSGQLKPEDLDEVVSAAFVAPDALAALPPNERSALESLAHFRATGQPRLG
ncbi:MAG: NUDIX domain-containing protein [Bacteroidetes bacterium]|nr:MAG: NUDIX domain-containing protein [Bacteroidota bacterium]